MVHATSLAVLIALIKLALVRFTLVRLTVVKLTVKPDFIRWITAAFLLTTFHSSASAMDGIAVDHKTGKGVFLVATEKLNNSSFKETVILITHYSARGASGLAINRPSTLSLGKAFPQIKELQDHDDEMFLGGPVETTTVFVLMRTKRPHAGMRPIVNDLYFTLGINALAHGLKNIKDDESARAYAGYAGWAPGQLDAEINRGDWLVVHADTDIIFEEDHENIWKKLFKAWSGQWI